MDDAQLRRCFFFSLIITCGRRRGTLLRLNPYQLCVNREMASLRWNRVGSAPQDHYAT
ncbi:MAG: hypothetical protein CM15mP84_10490 [Cellvibrionales bacterium]|nr:MAG: hypothetical protein CM15mP84_10490 [Cellvibrionales bacterium]